MTSPVSRPHRPTAMAGQQRWAGPRIRERRRRLGLTQAALAGQAGISASYLNLIEANKRPVAGGLLRRLATVLGVPLSELADGGEGRLLADLTEMAGDPVLAGAGLGPAELRNLLTAAPAAAGFMLRLYRAYRTAQAEREALQERLSQDPALAAASHSILTRITSVRSFAEILRDYTDLEPARRQHFSGRLVAESERLAAAATDMFGLLEASGRDATQVAPEEEVDDLLHQAGNYFPTLERAAAALRPAMDGGGGIYLADLIRHLDARHGVRVRRLPPDELDPRGYAWDAEARELHLSQALAPPTSRFQAARLVGRLEAAQPVEAVLGTAPLSSGQAVNRAREALLSYFAACLAMPYERFRAAARTLRHDIALLQQSFGASWEQVCHRLTTLRRPGAEGVPFHFLRTDIAGNISKRFSTTGLPLPRYAGVCPRWAVHAAFLAPGQVVTQLTRTEDGQTHLFVARGVNRAEAGYRAPQTWHAIMLACDAAFAAQLVYADGLTRAAALDVGITCRQCGREPCGQRAAARFMPPAASDVARAIRGPDDMRPR